MGEYVLAGKKVGRRDRKAAFYAHLRTIAADDLFTAKRSGAKKLLARTLVCFFSTLLLGFSFLTGVLLVIFRGPSEAARDLLVCSLEETSALKFVPRLFLSDELVGEILAPEPDSFRTLRVKDVALPLPEGEAALEESSETVELRDIRGTTWKGKLLIIRDPSLVEFASLPSFGEEGRYLRDFVSVNNALAGTNAGGFEDPDGMGNGSIPDGLVIAGGRIVWGSPHTVYNGVAFFDEDDRLHVGCMSGQAALDQNARCGVSFAPGPTLIMDGERQSGWGSSLNPRTCIGQREDGTVLLAVIEGRYPASLGATYDDLADLMEDYGAVNAANLDGGSSSTMFYRGEQITRGSNIVGARPLPTAILVMREGNKG